MSGSDLGTPEVVSSPAPLLVDVTGLAALLDISPRQVARLDSGGKLPAAIELGRCKRWNLCEIESWLDAGAPPRQRWSAMRRDGQNLRSSLAAPRGREQGHGASKGT